MSDQETEEPSIEEILTSIRQIISDDDEEGEGDADAGDAEEKVLDYSEDDDVAGGDLDLSQEEEAAASSDLDLSQTEEPSEAADAEADEEVIELTEAAEEEAELPEAEPEESEPEPEDAEPIEVDMQDAEEEPVVDDTSDLDDSFDSFDDKIMTDDAKAAALQGFTELAKKTAIESNGITIEDIVRTELNPMLRDWLDKHLPAIIERLVQEELDKIAKRATEDD